MRMDRSLPLRPPERQLALPLRPPERQLALPLEPVVGPLALAGFGPVVPPQRAWRSFMPATQADVRRAIRRICQEVVDDAAGR
jgi:hypothetical protein